MNPLRLLMTSYASMCTHRRRRIRWIALLGGMVAVILLLAAFVREPRLVFEEGTDVMVPLRPQHRNQEEYIDKRGIHVVVGHYIGDEIPGRGTLNLTDEILNTNGYSPDPRAGENGKPVQIPVWENSKKQMLYRINQFNLLASDRIPVNRSLPDFRKKSCQRKKYESKSLPTTSIIIVFHNEAWSTLLRTVHSVISRSPASLLKEIILVDDFSQRSFLKEPLDDYVGNLTTPTVVLRTEKRSGLVRARLIGARHAQGDILTFLDAHCEVTLGWLEPLLSRISEDNSRVVCPTIDIIDEGTFQYVKSLELHWGAFNWNLLYRWYTRGYNELVKEKQSKSDVYRTPAMAGGLFSINRKFFYRIGSYDKEMDIWGGENLEMSFRVWMCGGSVETSPCSRVGHVFRKISPYSFPGKGGVGGILYRNLARVALVWMDEWSNFFFKMNPEAEAVRHTVNVTERQNLRKSLKCHNFKWYLDNIWDSHFFPDHDRFFGKIRHKYSSKCLQRPQYPGGSIYPSGPAVLKECVLEAFAPQSFVFTKKGFIMTDESVCLDAPDSEEASEQPRLRITPCFERDRQRWTYDKTTKQIVHILTKLCLDLTSKETPDTPSLQQCDSWSLKQQWIFQHEDWDK